MSPDTKSISLESLGIKNATIRYQLSSNELHSETLAKSQGVESSLGAIARSAEVFGIHGLIVPSKESAKISPGSIRASSGALEHIEFTIVNSINKTIQYKCCESRMICILLFNSRIK